MSGYDKLSISPGFSVDCVTGEAINIGVSDLCTGTSKRVEAYIQPSFTQHDIDVARAVTSPIGEDVLCSLLGGKKMKKKNTRGYDLLLPAGEQMEAKTGRIGSGAVIKNKQLDAMDSAGFYGIVYYRTTGNKPPSYFTSRNTRLSPEVYLKRNIHVKTVFIFPKAFIVYFYNTSQLVEGIIKGTGVRHKSLSYKNATGLFHEELGGYEKYEDSSKYGRHEINLFSVGYKISGV